MKIRSGFVSNSSSASFIITIEDANFNDIIRIFDTSYIWYDYEQTLKGWKRIYEYEPNDDDFKKVYKERLEDTDKKITDLNDLIQKEDHTPIYKEMLDFYGIKWEEQGKNITFYSDTSMFNRFGDLNNILKELILYYVFNNIQKKLHCKVRED